MTNKRYESELRELIARGRNLDLTPEQICQELECFRREQIKSINEVVDRAKDKVMF